MDTPIPRPRVLLFDVNETLLDIGPLKEKVGDLLQDPSAGTLWFTTMLQYSLAMTVSSQYAALGEIGAATLQMLARNSDIALSKEDAQAVLAGLRTLDAHPDVAPALQRLRGAGFRMATLTNSPPAGVQAQTRHAGIDAFFEKQLTVESVGRFKPDRSVYEWAAREMGVAPADCMLVAAHGWDVAGAQWAGMRSAFIAREGQQKFPLAEPPEIDVADLSKLAEKLGA
ncbi:MAG: haloacid dehalogenase type II [Ramlibacter sp.]|nr:haloacid dehalogenase type II [Ramlibacter sp.]